MNGATGQAAWSDDCIITAHVVGDGDGGGGVLQGALLDVSFNVPISLFLSSVVRASPFCRPHVAVMNRCVPRVWTDFLYYTSVSFFRTSSSHAVLIDSAIQCSAKCHTGCWRSCTLAFNGYCQCMCAYLSMVTSVNDAAGAPWTKFDLGWEMVWRRPVVTSVHLLTDYADDVHSQRRRRRQWLFFE